MCGAPWCGVRGDEAKAGMVNQPGGQQQFHITIGLELDTPSNPLQIKHERCSRLNRFNLVGFLKQTFGSRKDLRFYMLLGLHAISYIVFLKCGL